VSDFVAALHRPDAQLSWEKSATGYILRQTISDQLSKTTKQNAFLFTPVDASVVQSSMSPGDAPDCGPQGALLDRIIIGDQEIPRTSVYALALQIVGPTLVQKQAAAKTTSAAQAPASPAPAAAAQTVDLTALGKAYPAAYAQWQHAAAAAGFNDDWSKDLTGDVVTGALRTITLTGKPYLFGSLCVAHSCGSMESAVMFPQDQSKAFGFVLDTPDGSNQAVQKPVGAPTEAEAACLEKAYNDEHLKTCD
jgi:hypothetical protein